MVLTFWDDNVHVVALSFAVMAVLAKMPGI